MSSIPARMRAVQLTGHGGLDRFVYRTDVPMPRATPGEVRFEVSSCGMNNTGVWVRLGAACSCSERAPPPDSIHIARLDSDRRHSTPGGNCDSLA